MNSITRSLTLITAVLLLPLALAMSQEVSQPAPSQTLSPQTQASQSQQIVISDFPLGVGNSVSPDFFEPYYAELQKLVDTLNKYPLAQAIVTGSADGYQYRASNDAKNTGLALGRAHALRNVLVNEFDVAPARIVVQSIDVKAEGGSHRYASVRIAWEMTALQAQIDTLALRPPGEKIVIPKYEIPEFEIPKAPLPEMGLQLGAGITTSPFGGMPIFTGGMTWKRIVFVEGILGHTFWNNSFTFQGAKLTTKRRMAGVQVIAYPFENKKVGFVGGWVRFEELSQTFYEYVKLSEGPMIGMQAAANDFLLVTAVYNPSKHRIAGDLESDTKNGQFLLSLTAHVNFGGGR